MAMRGCCAEVEPPSRAVQLGVRSDETIYLHVFIFSTRLTIARKTSIR